MDSPCLTLSLSCCADHEGLTDSLGVPVLSDSKPRPLNDSGCLQAGFRAMRIPSGGKKIGKRDRKRHESVG